MEKVPVFMRLVKLNCIATLLFVVVPFIPVVVQDVIQRTSTIRVDAYYSPLAHSMLASKVSSNMKSYARVAFWLCYNRGYGRNDVCARFIH